MSVKSESTHTVHIRKKRLLDSLKEYPELNNNGLKQQVASDEPANQPVLATSSNENFQMISGNANENEPRSKAKIKVDIRELEKLRIQVENLENARRIMEEKLFKAALATVDLVHLAEELDEQKEFEEEQNIDVQEVKTEKPETENISSSAEYQPQMQIENRFVADKNGMVCKSSSAEYQPQMQIKNRFVADKNGMVCKSSSAKYQPQMQIENRFVADESGMVCIGPNGTMVPSISLASINWSISGAAITRKILVEIFGREALAANNLTGKQSPAFINCDKPEKGQLDPKIVADIIHFMGKQTGLTPKEVRNAIITKCADENKMLRLREKKRKLLQHEI